MKRIRLLIALEALLGLAVTPVVAAAHSTVIFRGQTQCRQVFLTFDAGATVDSAAGIMDA